MSEVQSLPLAGYLLQKLYSPELHYFTVEVDEVSVQDERNIRVAWDWRIVGERAFEVLLDITMCPSKQRHDQAQAKVVGYFVAMAGDQKVPFDRFVTLHAPTLMLPYVRETLSSLFARGPIGPDYLPPINVHRMAKDFDFPGATGCLQLKRDENLVRSFALVPEPTALKSGE